MSFRQFVGLIASLMAITGLAIDTMLPALGQISAGFGLPPGNQQQWVITGFALGFGGAQIVYGPLADRFGRKAVLLSSLGIYIVCSLLASAAWSFEGLIIARFLQGIGAAGARVITVSIVRDCYKGREMARVTSLAFLVFLGVPVLAPSLGQLIMLVAPWRAIFIALALAAGAICTLAWLKLPETLHPQYRRKMAFAPIAMAFGITLQNRVSLFYTLAVTLISGALMGFINSAQQIFADTFHQPKLFALVFAAIAASIAAASLLNARLVERLGTRLISHSALLGFIALAALHTTIALSGRETLLVFALLQAGTMFCFGLLAGNFGAMSMEPLGEIAGTAASLQGFVATVGGALLGFAIGQFFNGSVLPLTLGFTVYGGLALLMVLAAENFRLFQSHHVPGEFRSAT